jgi:hypothetical protein
LNLSVIVPFDFISSITDFIVLDSFGGDKTPPGPSICGPLLPSFEVLLKLSSTSSSLSSIMKTSSVPSVL